MFLYRPWSSAAAGAFGALLASSKPTSSGYVPMDSQSPNPSTCPSYVWAVFVAATSAAVGGSVAGAPSLGGGPVRTGFIANQNGFNTGHCAGSSSSLKLVTCGGRVWKLIVVRRCATYSDSLPTAAL